MTGPSPRDAIPAERAFGGSADGLRLVLLSTVYPSAREPWQGLFVQRRLDSVPGLASARVVAPAPWFPLASRPGTGFRPPRPRREVVGGRTVERPRFLSIPRFGKALDGPSLFLRSLPVLRRLSREEPIDVLDAHFVYPEGFAAVLLGRALGLPVVLTLRGVLGQLAAFPARRAEAAFALRSADRVIALSESLREMAAALGRPAERVALIPNAVDGELFACLDRGEARRRLGLTGPGPRLLFVGTPSPRKGLERVVDALPALAARWPQVELLVVGGSGAERSSPDALRRRARRLGVGDRIAFVGARPPEQLAAWYSAADLFVLPSRLEGSPNALLEALACGTPAVATPVGEIAEVLASSGGGLLAPQAGDLAPTLEAALSRGWDRGAIRAWALRRRWPEVGAAVRDELRGAVEEHAARRPRPARAPAPEAAR
jgi:glycosyltransferase involved in cell wall biosynthesis